MPPMENLKEKRSFTVLLLVPGILLVGTLFYALEEGWSPVNALYFSVITLTTIGYGDLSPSSHTSKLFTVFYVICGVALFGVFIRDIANRTINTISSPLFGAKVMVNNRRLAKQLNLPTSRGIVVLSVSESGILGRSGVRDKDVIIAINQKTVSRTDQIFELVTGSLFGAPAEFTIARPDGLHRIPVRVFNE